MAKAIPVHVEDDGEVTTPLEDVSADTSVEVVDKPQLVPVATPAGVQPSVASPFHREDF